MFCKKCAYGYVDNFGDCACYRGACVVPEIIQENWNYKHNGHPSTEDILNTMEDENFDPFNRQKGCVYNESVCGERLTRVFRPVQTN